MGELLFALRAKQGWKKGEGATGLKKEESITETVDPTIEKVGEIAKNTDLVSMRKPLENIFNKKDIDFSMDPIPHFRIKYKGKTLVIVNKKYADNAELVVNDKAIGYEGQI